MDFTSVIFLVFFLPMSLLLVRLIKSKRNLMICLASLVFYSWCGVRFLIVALVSSAVAYLAGRVIEKRKGSLTSKCALFFSVAYCIIVLALYKYIPFSAETAPAILRGMYNDTIALPLGLSFYSFSIISYLLDVYWGKCLSQKSIISMLMYVFFFPKVVQGPMMRYSDFEAQLTSGPANIDLVNEGIERFVKGMVKKVMIADCIKPLADYSFSGISDIGTIPAWTGILVYMLQLYYDFSGYSDMAVGLGKMLGINMPENFSHPFFSRSVSEYWRRWHISLGEWFKDYVYTPCFRLFVSLKFLPKSKKGRKYAADIISLFVTWSLIGIWHGSGLKFYLYGLWWFIFIVIERTVDFIRKASPKDKKLKTGGKMALIINYIVTFFSVIFGMVLFRADSLENTFLYWSKMLSWSKSGTVMLIYMLDNYVVIAMIIAVAFMCPLYDYIKNKVIMRSKVGMVVHKFILVVAAVVCFTYAVSAGFSSFLYEVF